MRYDAFLCHARRDDGDARARALRVFLEKSLPELRPIPDPRWPARPTAFPAPTVFLDAQRLVHAELERTITDALRVSRRLIVMASDATRDSTWVPREIGIFVRDLGRSEGDIIWVVAQGEHPEHNAFALATQVGLTPSTPILDLRSQSRDRAAYRRAQSSIAAAVLPAVAGHVWVSEDIYPLVSEEDHRRLQIEAFRRRVLGLIGIALMTLIVALAVLFMLQRDEAQEQRDLALKALDGTVEELIELQRIKGGAPVRQRILSKVAEPLTNTIDEETRPVYASIRAAVEREEATQLARTGHIADALEMFAVARRKVAHGFDDSVVRVRATIDNELGYWNARLGFDVTESRGVRMRRFMRARDAFASAIGSLCGQPTAALTPIAQDWLLADSACRDDAPFLARAEMLEFATIGYHESRHAILNLCRDFSCIEECEQEAWVNSSRPAECRSGEPAVARALANRFDQVWSIQSPELDDKRRALYDRPWDYFAELDLSFALNGRAGKESYDGAISDFVESRTLMEELGRSERTDARVRTETYFVHNAMFLQALQARRFDDAGRYLGETSDYLDKNAVSYGTEIDDKPGWIEACGALAMPTARDATWSAIDDIATRGTNCRIHRRPLVLVAATPYILVPGDEGLLVAAICAADAGSLADLGHESLDPSHPSIEEFTSAESCSAAASSKGLCGLQRVKLGMDRLGYAVGIDYERSALLLFENCGGSVYSGLGLAEISGTPFERRPTIRMSVAGHGIDAVLDTCTERSLDIELNRDAMAASPDPDAPEAFIVDVGGASIQGRAVVDRSYEEFSSVGGAFIQRYFGLILIDFPNKRVWATPRGNLSRTEWRSSR